MNLAELISRNHDKIKETLHCGYVNWDDLINRIERQLRNKSHDFADEQVWTFLIACGYAIAGKDGVKELCSILTKKPDYKASNIYIEVLPISPRIKEGPTHLDLAVGNIGIRQGTESGIELKPKTNSWIAFCEMKWYSDISHNVSYDQHRNQLARVIENALSFQRDGVFSENVFVNLVTPEAFMDLNNKSRLYSYKFEEYRKSKDRIIQDLNYSTLEKHVSTSGWKNPVIEDRVSKLSLNWISFEKLFSSLPESEISEKIKEFESKFNNSKN